MNDKLESEVLRVLEDNIRQGSGERKLDRDWLEHEVKLAGDSALKLFLEVHNALIGRTPRHRTRRTARTSIEGIGVSYYTSRGRLFEIQAVLLPTKEHYRGQIVAYFKGHSDRPITVPDCLYHEIKEEMHGKPVYRITASPSPDLSRQLIRAFEESCLCTG